MQELLDWRKIIWGIIRLAVSRQQRKEKEKLLRMLKWSKDNKLSDTRGDYHRRS